MSQAKRRQLLIASGALLAAPIAARAQGLGRGFQVGLLSIGTPPEAAHRWQAFIDAMRNLGYVEGGNLAIRRAFGAGRSESLPGLIAELVRSKVDVIVTTGTREIAALKKDAPSIPAVMTLAHDPVGQGFVASLARPGGNVTGLTAQVPGLNQKYVELLCEAIPSARRFAVVNLPPNPTPEIRRELETAATALGIGLSIVQPKSGDDIDRALADARKGGAAGIIHPIDGGTGPYRRALAQSALKHGLPGIYWDRDYVEEGGFMTYSASFAHLLQRAAVYVDKILKGAKPGELPVEQPTKFELVFNLKTAKALGIKVAQGLLLRAERVIE